jgi:ribonuclease P protein component
MERLKRRTDFRAAASGTRAPNGAFVLQARRRNDQDGVRVGFTVSRQVGNAVERNRVRRRLRELVRLTQPQNLQAGHDYVLIGRRAALETSFGRMMQELSAALDRIHTSDRQGTGSPRQGPLHDTSSPVPGRPGPQPTTRRKPANARALNERA